MSDRKQLLNGAVFFGLTAADVNALRGPLYHGNSIFGPTSRNPCPAYALILAGRTQDMHTAMYRIQNAGRWWWKLSVADPFWFFGHSPRAERRAARRMENLIRRWDEQAKTLALVEE